MDNNVIIDRAEKYVRVYICIVYLDQLHIHIPIRKRQESEISHILNL